MQISLIDKAARRILLGKLGRISGGCITIKSDRTDTVGLSDGEQPEAHIYVNDPSCFRKIVLCGTTGAAESYINRDWDSEDMVELLGIIKSNQHVYEHLDSGWSAVSEWINHTYHALNRNSRKGSLKNIMAHYDLGNDFFELFLDDTMAYSAGIYETDNTTLREASIAKFDRICRKLDIGRKDRVVEIGTGWGGFAVHAAENYGCELVTTTISRKQHSKASELVREKGLDGKITVLNRDYRDLDGKFDKLVSIEMIEAVGHRYLDAFFAKCCDLLKDAGMMAIQAITVPDDRYHKHRRQSSFINKYIFPGSHLLSCGEITKRAERLCGMQLIDDRDITLDYSRTLHDWRRRFGENIDKVRKLGLSEEFVRMWDFYFAYCEAAFGRRWIGDHQLVYAKSGNGRYRDGG